MDISANSFRHQLERDWLGARNGFRIAGGSISGDRLALMSELRLNQDFSNHLAFGLSWKQDDFYANKPNPLPQLALKFYPVEGSNLGVAALGTAAHDKRQADLGYAVFLGREPDDYVRFAWTKVDVFYNEKNEFDDSFYREFGETATMDGVKAISDRWLVQFRFERDRPLSLAFDDNAGRFDHKRYDHELTTYFQYSAKYLFGASWRMFDISKSRRETGFSQAQELEYLSAEIFWVTQFQAPYELTLGMRHDEFDERLINRVVPAESYGYRLRTTQGYASLRHEYKAQQAWDLGLYAGWSEQERDFRGVIPEGEVEENSEGLEAKLRTSWSYHSLDQQSALRISVALDLDDAANDLADGGGIYYQTRF